MTPKLASLLLGRSGLIALAIASFWLLKRAYDMRVRADRSGNAIAKTRAAAVSNLVLACALTAPLAYILSDVPLSLGFAWRDMSWHVLLGGVGCVALLALGGAYWRSRMVPDSPVTPARVASIFARQGVLVAGLFLLPLALEHHGVGAWARYIVVVLALTAFEFWRLQKRKVVWDAPRCPSTTGERAGGKAG